MIKFIVIGNIILLKVLVIKGFIIIVFIFIMIVICIKMVNKEIFVICKFCNKLGVLLLILEKIVFIVGKIELIV